MLITVENREWNEFQWACDLQTAWKDKLDFESHRLQQITPAWDYQETNEIQ